MSLKKRVEEYVKSFLEPYNIKEANSIERALNEDAISEDIRFFRDIKVPDEEIDKIVRRNVEKGVEKGGVGRYFTASVPRRFFRRLKQRGELKVPSTGLYYLFHPLKAMGMGLRKLLFGYEDYFKDKEKQMGELQPYLEKIPYLPIRKLFNYLSEIISRSKVIDSLEKAGFISSYKARSKKDELKKDYKKGEKKLVSLETKVEHATAVILLFLIGISLISYSLFKPNVTGYVVLESGQSVPLGIIFGVAFLIVAFGFLYIKKILKNKK